MNALIATMLGLGVAAATAGGAYLTWDFVEDDCEASAAGGSVSGMAPAGGASSGTCDWSTYEGCGGEPAEASDEPGEVVLVRFRLDNRMDAVETVTCLTDAAGMVYSIKQTKIPAKSEVYVDHEVPSGEYSVTGSFSGSFDKMGQGRTTHGTVADLDDCDGGGFEFAVRIEFDSPDAISTTGGGSGCFAAAHYPRTTSWDPEAQSAGILPGGDDGQGPAMWALVGGASLVAVGAVVWKWESVRWLFAGLFSRIERSKVLDQATRNEIHELVLADPGVHGSEVARRLDLAEGQTRYHLDVLVREKALASVSVAGRTHYFRHGERSPVQMRAAATLRSENARRLYDVVQSRPRLPLSEAARHAGLSLSSASKVADSLEQVALIERHRRGRTVHLVPTSQN